MSVGGLEVFSANLARLLAAKDNRVGIIIFRGDKTEALRDIDLKGVDIFFARRRHKLDFSFVAYMCGVLKAFKPDVMLCLSGFAYFFAGIASRITEIKAPRCIRFSSSEPLSVKERILTRFFIFVSRACGASYIFISEKQADFYRRTYGIQREKRSFVIYNGVDTNFFTPPGFEKNGIFTIIHIANARPVKDQQVLLRSLQELSNKVKKWRLVFIGERGEALLNRFSLNLQNSDLAGKVVLTSISSRQKIRDALSEAHVFVLTSLSEGLPNSALEAMSMGLPSILTDVGGCSEIVTDGYNGYLVKPGDCGAIADRLLFLYENPDARFRMGKNARGAAEDKFRIDKCASNYMAAFKQVTHV